MGKRYNLLDIVHDPFTNSSGFQLLTHLIPYIDMGETVSISLSGVTVLSSSFLNSSIHELIEKYGFDTFKKYVKFVDVPVSAAKIIRNYLNDYIIER
jgi:hypothetical protein